MKFMRVSSVLLVIFMVSSCGQNQFKPYIFAESSYTNGQPTLVVETPSCTLYATEDMTRDNETFSVDFTALKIIDGNRTESVGDYNNYIKALYPQFEYNNAGNIFEYSEVLLVNGLIKNEALKVLDSNPLYKENNFSYFLDYHIKHFDGNIISVYFTSRYGVRIGEYGLNNHAHGITIDLKNMRVIQLNEIIADISRFFDLLQDDLFEPILTFQDGDNICNDLFSETWFLDFYQKELLIEKLSADKAYENFNVQEPYPLESDFEWYLNENGIVIIVLSGKYYERYFIEFKNIEDILNEDFYNRYCQSQ